MNFYKHYPDQVDPYSIERTQLNRKKGDQNSKDDFDYREVDPHLLMLAVDRSINMTDRQKQTML